MSGQKKDRRDRRLRRRAARLAEFQGSLTAVALSAQRVAEEMCLVGYFMGRVAVTTREIRAGVYSHEVSF